MGVIAGIFGLFLFPTRLLIDHWKRGLNKDETARLLKKWNAYNLVVTILVCVAIGVAQIGSYEIPRYAFGAVAILALSRCNEIVYGFYKDAIDRLELGEQRSSFRATQRINLIILSYINLVFCFAIMHNAAQFFLGTKAYQRSISDIFDALYFSAVTITTTGYGDIVPGCAIPKLLCIYEPMAGIVLFVFALAVYLGGDKAKNECE